MRIPGESVLSYPAPHTTVRCPALLAAPSPSLPGQHLGVFLFVFAQHLRHRHQRLDLGHLPADVHQLGQVGLTDVVDRGQVPGWVALQQHKSVGCSDGLALNLPSLCPRQGKVCL